MENLEEIKRIQAAGMDVAAVERMKFMMLRHTDSGRLLAEDAGPVRLYFNHVDYKDMSESLYGGRIQSNVCRKIRSRGILPSALCGQSGPGHAEHELHSESVIIRKRDKRHSATSLS